MTLVQIGGGMSAQGAGLLTLGYAIAIVAFIRVGEKLLQRFGPRKPMIWGTLIVGVSIVLLMPTYVTLRYLQGPGHRGLHALRHRARILRHALHGRGDLNLPDDSGWVRIGHLQNGFIAWRILRRGHLGGDLHDAQW